MGAHRKTSLNHHYPVIEGISPKPFPCARFWCGMRGYETAPRFRAESFAACPVALYEGKLVFRTGRYEDGYITEWHLIPEDELQFVDCLPETPVVEPPRADFRPVAKPAVHEEPVKHTAPQEPPPRPSRIYMSTPRLPQRKLETTGTIRVTGEHVPIPQHSCGVYKRGLRYYVLDMFARERGFFTVEGLNRFFAQQGWNDVRFVA